MKRVLLNTLFTGFGLLTVGPTSVYAEMTTTTAAQPTASLTSLLTNNVPTLNSLNIIAEDLESTVVVDQSDKVVDKITQEFQKLIILPSDQNRRQTQADYCTGPPAKGCSNGMFNDELCQCDCIPPFCRDSMGECNQPLNNCGGNPWQNCVKGENCPWWVSTLSSETCTTGNSVPAGMWDIFPSKADCCRISFPYSKVCDVVAGTDSPTKYPTIAPPPKDEFEIVPIKFSVMGLPDDVKMRDLKNQMAIVLKRILTDLQDVFADLKISKVEERAVIERQRNLIVDERILAQDVDVYFDVYVINVNDKKWGPIIIAELHDSYGEIMDKIQTFQGVDYFGEGVEMNWCTTMNGKYTQCTREEKATPTYTNTVNTMNTPPPEKGGFPVWAIVLIVILVLLIACAIGYCIYISAQEEEVDAKAVNNIYMNDDRTRSGRSRRDRDGRSVRTDRSGRTRRSSRSRRSRAPKPAEGEFQLVLAGGEDPSFKDDDFTINTYKNRPDPSMYPGQLGYDGTDPNRPDPPDLGNVLMLTNGEDDGTRKYLEDPPLKPKRDPSMYVDGMGVDDPSMAYAGGGDDPSMSYGRDEPSVYSSRSRGARSQYSRNDDPSMQYDQYGAAQPDGDVQRMRSMYMGEEDASLQPDGGVERYSSMYMGGVDEESYGGGGRRAGRDEFDDGGTQMSFRTQEPDDESRKSAGQSYYSDGRSKVSRKSGKSGKGKKSGKKKSSNKKNMGPSLTSSWGDIMGQVEEDDYEMQQKAKSFYR